jgi:hypothetical protein
MQHCGCNPGLVAERVPVQQQMSQLTLGAVTISLEQSACWIWLSSAAVPAALTTTQAAQHSANAAYLAGCNAGYQAGAAAATPPGALRNRCWASTAQASASFQHSSQLIDHAPAGQSAVTRGALNGQPPVGAERATAAQEMSSSSSHDYCLFERSGLSRFSPGLHRTAAAQAVAAQRAAAMECSCGLSPLGRGIGYTKRRLFL